MQWQAKISADKVLFQENTAVTIITVTQDFFEQSKVGKREVGLNGNLYDIRSSEIRGDSIRLELYHDKDEQALYTLLGVHFFEFDSATNSQPQPMSVLVAQWLGADFLAPECVALPLAGLDQNKAVFHWRFPDALGIRVPPFLPPRNRSHSLFL